MEEKKELNKGDEGKNKKLEKKEIFNLELLLNLNKETEKNRKEIEREEEAKRKNARLELLLVGNKKKNFSIPTNENNNNNEIKLEKNNVDQSQNLINNISPNIIQTINAHINPLRKTSNNIKYYKYFKYSPLEIFEKMLDFEFYHNKQLTEEIPNTFDSEIHYKFIWIKNFYNELKNTLLSDRSESSEVNNYIKMDVEVNFIYLNDNYEQITLFELIPNKKLSDFRSKIFKENDIVAFYPINEKINFKDITFKNLNKLNYFIGIVQINNETYDLNCYVHNKYIKKFNLVNTIDQIKESKLFKTYYLGNLTSSLREYKAILNLELSNFTGILYSKDLFKEKEKENHLTLKSKLYLDNIKKKNIFNSSQTEAIIKASEMNRKDILLIQGPPGTGKTHTILGLLSLFLLNNDGKILICAPSNTAIDEISARIAKKGLLNENLEIIKNINFIRFGLYDRKEKENKYLYTSNGQIIQEYSLENLSDKRYKNKNNKMNSDLELVNKEINQTLKNENNLQKEIQEKNIYELKNRRYTILRQLTDLKAERKRFEFELLSHTKILCTTLNSSGSDRLKKMRINFDYLIIDEACQCIEPSALIPLCHNVKKLIMVGDHMQLPATVFSEDAVKTLYNRSLFERLIDNNYPRHILTIQYRMHFNIRNFIGTIFYDNQLKDDDYLIKKMKYDNIFSSIKEKNNFSFFDITYGKEVFDAEKGKSYFNESEVDFVLEIIYQIDKRIRKNKKKKKYKIDDDDYFNEILYEQKDKYKYAIITPYKSQVKLFIDKLKDIKFKLSDSIDIEINTVDSFQGQERDIVIFSTVRSNFLNDDEDTKIHTGIGFLNDFRRMNVALSRAKYACYVVGNSSTLKNNNYWKKLIDFCINHNCYYNISSFSEKKIIKKNILNHSEENKNDNYKSEKKKNINDKNHHKHHKKNNNNNNNNINNNNNTNHNEKILGNKREREDDNKK